MKGKTRKSLKLVLNKKAPKTVTNLEHIVTNLTGIVRNETLEGRDYVVVPMIMMVEGVLNGSNGPLFYPAEELEKVPAVWNMKPVVVYHPSQNGKALSACDPAVIDEYKVGLIMNTTFDGKRLKAEAWLESDRVAKVDNRVMEALQNNTMMEVSTGLFTENEEATGQFNGTDYVAIARNYRPDHLALLPDQVGACSIEDGAGLLRLNAASKKEMQSTLQLLGLHINESSHDDIRMSLYNALSASLSQKELWVVEIYETWFVYEVDEPDGYKYFKRSYKMEDDKAVLEGQAEEVERKIVYEPVNNQSSINNRSGEIKMDKALFVGNLIANKGTKWEDEDKDFLLGLSEDQLLKMEVTENKTATPAEEVVTEEVVTEEEPAQNEKVTTEAYLANAPAGVQEVLADALQTHADQKSILIGTITGNEKNIFTDGQLAAMSINELRAISAIAASPAAPAVKAPNYGGQAPISNAEAVTEEPLLSPTMNFSEAE